MMTQCFKMIKAQATITFFKMNLPRVTNLTLISYETEKVNSFHMHKAGIRGQLPFLTNTAKFKLSVR